VSEFDPGFGGILGFGTRPVLLIVDMAMAYFAPASPLYAGVEAALAATVCLRAAATTARVPVVFTRVEYGPGGRDGGLFYRKLPVLACFDRGNPLGDFHPDLQPGPDDIVITKHYPSAFFATPLASMLTAMRVDTVLVAGLTTSGCVRASALDALCHGFVPGVVADACGDRTPEVQAANLFDLQAKYADVIDSTAACAYFSGLTPA